MNRGLRPETRLVDQKSHAEARISDLTTKIEELAANSARLDTETKNLEKEVAENQATLDEATAKRQKQLAELNNSLLQMPRSHMVGAAATVQDGMQKHAALQGVLTHKERKVGSSFIHAAMTTRLLDDREASSSEAAIAPVLEPAIAKLDRLKGDDTSESRAPLSEIAITPGPGPMMDEVLHSTRDDRPRVAHRLSLGFGKMLGSPCPATGRGTTAIHPYQRTILIGVGIDPARGPVPVEDDAAYLLFGEAGPGACRRWAGPRPGQREHVVREVSCGGTSTIQYLGTSRNSGHSTAKGQPP